MNGVGGRRLCPVLPMSRKDVTEKPYAHDGRKDRIKLLGPDKPPIYAPRLHLYDTAGPYGSGPSIHAYDILCY